MKANFAVASLGLRSPDGDLIEVVGHGYRAVKALAGLVPEGLGISGRDC